MDENLVETASSCGQCEVIACEFGDRSPWIDHPDLGSALDNWLGSPDLCPSTSRRSQGILVQFSTFNPYPHPSRHPDAWCLLQEIGSDLEPEHNTQAPASIGAQLF